MQLKKSWMNTEKNLNSMRMIKKRRKRVLKNKSKSSKRISSKLGLKEERTREVTKVMTKKEFLTRDSTSKQFLRKLTVLNKHQHRRKSNRKNPLR